MPFGFAQFFFDKTISPYVSAGGEAWHLGLAKVQAGNKSKQVRDLLKMQQLHYLMVITK